MPFFYIVRSLDKGFFDLYHACMVPAISHISAARFWLSCGQQDIPRHFLDSSSNSKEYPLIADRLDVARSAFSIEQDEPLQYHERQFSIHRNSIKRNALIEQGVRVFTLSNEQFRDFEQFKRFATLLKETLGVRPRSRISDSEQRQKSLHTQLVRPFAL